VVVTLVVFLVVAVAIELSVVVVVVVVVVVEVVVVVVVVVEVVVVVVQVPCGNWRWWCSSIQVPVFQIEEHGGLGVFRGIVLSILNTKAQVLQSKIL
jgi:hypothetical protein